MAPTSPAKPEVALGLALAMVEASDAPLLLLDEDLGIIAASASFSTTYKLDANHLQGRQLFEVGDGEWDVPQLRSLLTATAKGNAAVPVYEMKLIRKDKPQLCLAFKARKLSFADQGEARILVTIVDITGVQENKRVKERLVQDNSVLLQELQYRVANSLQIIASVLMESGRKVQSDEAREHLNDAHNMEMSLATVQNQLSLSHLGDVALLPYFTQLCESIGASMIADHKRVTLDVTADESVVSAEVSVSLGLIVTELVINALKHAFPNNRSGKIVVDYQGRGPNWKLTVGDDGVGMPTGGAKAKPGLGTGIVEALAKQLEARIQVKDANPGTEVRVAHTQIAIVAENGPELGRAI
jgi:two-component sensor histidine kinase